jgi:hypothetical protein
MSTYNFQVLSHCVSFLSNDFPVKNILAQVACAFISLGSRYREIFDQMEHDTRKLEQLAGNWLLEQHFCCCGEAHTHTRAQDFYFDNPLRQSRRKRVL